MAQGIKDPALQKVFDVLEQLAELKCLAWEAVQQSKNGAIDESHMDKIERCLLSDALDTPH